MMLVQGITDTGTLACLVPEGQVDNWRATMDRLSRLTIVWSVEPVTSENLNDALREVAGRG